MGRVLALCCGALLLVAFWAQYSSPILQALAARTANAPMRVIFFTRPALRLSYGVTNRKAVLKKAATACTAEHKERCFNGEFDYYYIPKDTDPHSFWQQFKETLSTWRYNPFLLFKVLYAYTNALVQHRTNIMPGQAILFSLELVELSAADFVIEQPIPAKKKQGKQLPVPQPSVKQTPPPAKAATTPLKVVILNASGKKGQAESLKQYLRAQHAKGLLQVDVYDTGNYPSRQDISFIEDYSGQLVQVTQLSHAIGIHSEIRSLPPSGEIYYDVRVVLGTDFKMPL